MPKRIEAPGNYGGTGRPESFRKPDSEIPGEPSIPENPPHRKVAPEETPLPPEISISPENLSKKVEPFEERQPEKPPSPTQETIKDWLQRQVGEAEEKGILTKKEIEKIALASTIWAVDGIISSAVGVPLLAASTAFWRTRGNPLILACNLIPGALRVGTIIYFEKRFGVQFSRESKVVSFLPTFPAGWAMPYEIATTLGKSRLLFSTVKERYLTSPLGNLNKALQDFRSVFKR